MKNVSNSYKKNSDAQEDEINLKQIFEQYAYYWKWFVISIFLTVAIGCSYLYYSTPQYKVDAKILLEKEDKASGELSGLAELSSLTGGSGQSAFVLDQIDILKSRRLLRKVVESNNLQYSYFIKDNLKELEILESDSPVKVVSSTMYGNKDLANISLIISDANSFSLKEKGNDWIENVPFGKSVKTKFGEVVLIPNKDIQEHIGSDLTIQIRSVDNTIDYFQKVIQVAPNSEKQSYIVNFSLTGPVIQKSRLILNSLIKQYNEDVSEDKNKLTNSTTLFINSRLKLIGQDLDIADRNVQSYKANNNMTDLVAESELNLKTLSEADKDVLEKRTQVQLVDYMVEAMNKGVDLELLPTNVGLSDQSIEKNLVEYNKMILERSDLLNTSTKENPVVKNITENIHSLKKNLKVSLDNYRSVLMLSLKSAEGKKNQLQGRISGIPNQEFGFREIARQQQTVESIYLFLLQKREENEIKASAEPAVLKVIDGAYGSTIPVAPKKSIILFGAIILGLIIPLVVLYIRFLLDNKVQTRKDVETFFPAPILVEVPISSHTVVEANDRSSLAEAFRILRTNLSFMLGTDKKDAAVIFVTSTTSGEGKSFVSTNLSRILAMSGKRVLLLGADIRSPKVLDYLGLSYLQHTNIGITQYLINPSMDIDNIIIKKPESYEFDIIYSGYVAPNPAELLMNGHFDSIIKYGREHYDYVIVDTAPVSLVTDTLLIADSADLTVYVTRANYLDKRMLNVPKELYDQGKLKNMAVVLNGVNFEKGYGYGYGYGYGDEAKPSLKKKIKKFFKK